VTGLDGDAPGGEVWGVFGVGVTPGDAKPAKGEELREGAHPGAGDADEVDGPRIGWIEEAGHDGGAI
jgi:hypothetical protein